MAAWSHSTAAAAAISSPPLTERTTVAANQTKQVGFLEVSKVAARKTHEFSSQVLQTLERSVGASVVVQFENALRTGLGAALPAGVIRVYAGDSRGQPTFIGEAVFHTPRRARSCPS
jgi:hypothetical protein